MTKPQKLLLLLTGINMLNYLDRYVVSSVLEPIGLSLRLSDYQMGWIQPMFLVGYMLAAPLFGFLGDRMNRARLVAFGIALWSLATAGAALVHSYPTLLMTRSLVGVGEAAYAALGPAMLSDCFPEHERAAKFTWFYLAIPVGSALGFGLGGLVAGHWGWRAAFLVSGLPGLLLAAYMAFQADPVRGAFDTMVDAVANAPFAARLKAIFTNRIWLACTGSYVAYTFAMGVLTAWGPTLLQRVHHADLKDVGLFFGAITVLTGIAGTFAGGKLTDRLQHRWPDAGVWISGLTLLAAAPLVALALRSSSLHLAYAAFSLGLLFLFVNTSPVNALTVSCIPSSIRATGVALNVLLIHLMGDALSPEWVGRRSTMLTLGGLDRGAALAQAMHIALPAIVASGLLLWWARGWKPSHHVPEATA
ncbi:MAG TPA: MFS transporter [Holophagaceae bacterium]|nr:MFS transporter [Holophagaceae bacterium]